MLGFEYRSIGKTSLALICVTLVASAVVRAEPVQTIPETVIFPGDKWQWLPPADAGLDVAAYEAVLKKVPMGAKGFGGNAPGADEWGAVLTRGGYLVQTWGNPGYKTPSASLGKCLTRVLVGITAERGLIHLDDPIAKSWTGRGELSHPHKYLDAGNHSQLTWRQLVNHQGGFILESGHHWRNETFLHATLPRWAKSTKDPLFDNFSHTSPGTVTHYSSGGYWRLGQALTAVWQKDLKQVLQSELFDHLSIPADRWDWLSGKAVHANQDFYPAFPGYGDYVDPPYEISGHIVRGGPGWFAISSEDLARFGLLIATGGQWKGKQLVGREWLQGHAGLDIHVVAGDPQTLVSIAKVNTGGFPFGGEVGTQGAFAFPKELIARPTLVRP